MLQNLTLLLARVLLSAIFLQAGFNKLMGPVSSIAYIAKLGLPVPQATWALTVAVELIGGLMILVGFRTRLAAPILAVFCVVTAFAAHYHPGDTGQMIHFMKNLAIAGGFLQLAATGPGRYAIGRS